LSGAKNWDTALLLSWGILGITPDLAFLPSARFGIGCEYDAPEEAFMVVELQPGYLRGKTGTIKYHAAFKHV